MDPAAAPTNVPSSTGDATMTSYPNGDDTTAPPEPVLTEEEEELRDALSPVYDQLSLKWIWWLLEFIPMKHKYQRSDTTWEAWLGFVYTLLYTVMSLNVLTRWNLARARVIPKQKKGYKVHRSVKLRMEAEHEEYPGIKYKPRAMFSVEPTWVD
jgi:hypothetical protein